MEGPNLNVVKQFLVSQLGEDMNAFACNPVEAWQTGKTVTITVTVGSQDLD